MATRDLELQRFARKAAGYRAALTSFPHARAIELSAVIAIINALCENRGWDRTSVQIIDLMAGTGILSSKLRESGYLNLTAIELCDEMHVDATQASPVEWIKAESLVAGLEECRKRRPQVVVSLAAFHHLISYVGDRVDRLASAVKQHSLIGQVCDCMASDGVLLIVDLAEESFLTAAKHDLQMRFDKGVGVPAVHANVTKVIAQCPGTIMLESAIANWRGKVAVNPSLRWFREIVDAETVIGHKDMALTKELVSMCDVFFRTRCSTIRCPWLFSSEADLESFVIQKFGFLVERAPQEIDRNQLGKSIKQHLGSKEHDGGGWSLDWRLGVLTVEKSSVSSKTTVDEDILLLGIIVCLCGLLIGRLGVIALAPGAFATIEPVLSRFTWVFAGMLLAKLLQLFVQRRWKLWR